MSAKSNSQNISKLNKFFLLVFILFLCSPSNISAGEISIPLPPGSLKISQNPARVGPIKAVTSIYQTSWAPDKVDSFYKKEMRSSGWSTGNEGVFLKDNYIVIVVINPLRDAAGKISFSHTISKILDKEEILASDKVQPEKLAFMPAYPGSHQLFLWNTSIGVMGTYETESSVKEVAFFYKSGMLKYGWVLEKESPVKISNLDKKVSLTFYRLDGSACSIIITDLPEDPDSSAISQIVNGKKVKLEKRTTILVNYNEHKNSKS